jgi:hypothetical protein
MLQRMTSRRNAMLLLRLFIAFAIILVLYSIAFQYLMNLEGRRYSYISGLYWIISTMCTVGLGDITFLSDFGRLFTVLVISTGIFFLLVLLPFNHQHVFRANYRKTHADMLCWRNMVL